MLICSTKIPNYISTEKNGHLTGLKIPAIAVPCNQVIAICNFPCQLCMQPVPTLPLLICSLCPPIPSFRQLVQSLCQSFQGLPLPQVTCGLCQPSQGFSHPPTASPQSLLGTPTSLLLMTHLSQENAGITIAKQCSHLIPCFMITSHSNGNPSPNYCPNQKTNYNIKDGNRYRKIRKAF